MHTNKYKEGKRNPKLEPKSDFERLIIATKYVEQLKKEKSELMIEIGRLQSEVDEANHYKELYEEAVKKRNVIKDKYKQLESVIRKNGLNSEILVGLSQGDRSFINKARNANEFMRELNTLLHNGSNLHEVTKLYHKWKDKVKI